MDSYHPKQNVEVSPLKDVSAKMSFGSMAEPWTTMPWHICNHPVDFHRRDFQMPSPYVTLALLIGSSGNANGASRLRYN